MAAGDPFRWVAADGVYGVGAPEMALRRAAEAYVLGVDRNSEFHSWCKARSNSGSAEKVAAALDEADWKRPSACAGTEGPRLRDRADCERADRDGSRPATVPSHAGRATF